MTEQNDLPHQDCLVDFDLGDPLTQVIGGDAMDFSDMETEPVLTLLFSTHSLTIHAHKGEGQTLADLMHHNPSFKDWVVYYADEFRPKSVMSFAMRAHTDGALQRAGLGHLIGANDE